MPVVLTSFCAGCVLHFCEHAKSTDAWPFLSPSAVCVPVYDCHINMNSNCYVSIRLGFDFLNHKFFSLIASN